MSPQVGQAGKRLFEFFERRWEQLAPNMDWEREGGKVDARLRMIMIVVVWWEWNGMNEWMNEWEWKNDDEREWERVIES